MIPTQDINLRAEELIQSLCEDLINSEQLLELEDLVCSDQQICRYYIRTIHLHTGLRRHALAKNSLNKKTVPVDLSDAILDWQTQSEQAASIQDEPPSDEPLSDKVTLDPSLKNSNRLFSYLSNRWHASIELISTPTRLSLIIAAITMISLISTLAILTVPQYWNSRKTDESLAVAIAPPAVALIARTANCKWSIDSEKYLSDVREGRKIRVGDVLRLEQGQAKIRFFRGTQIILKGPAQLKIDSENSGNLLYGQVTAIVPHRAIGFEIVTSSAIVHDLGTEFAVMSDEKNGDTEIHVFVGKVKVKTHPNDQNKSESRILQAGDSIRVSLNSVNDFSPAMMQEEDEFTRTFPRADSDLPVTFGLYVHLAADQGIYRLPNGEILSWRDLSRYRRLFIPSLEVDDNNPTLEKDSNSKLPMVRFDGVGDMFSSKEKLQMFRAGYSSLTTFIVFRTDKNDGKKILIGHSHDVKKFANAHFQLGYDVGGGSGAGNFGVHRGSGSATIAPVDTIKNGQLQLMSTVILASESVPKNIEIYKNGKQVSSVIADGRMNPGWLAAGDYNIEKSILDIGGRNDFGKRERFDSFHQGDIAEVIIFRRDLNEKERKQIEAYLMKKWNLK